MPRLDAGMKEGTIVEWLKMEGDTVEKGDPLAKVEGEKVVFDVEAQARGVLGKIFATKGTTVRVGEPMAIITEEGEEVPGEEKVPERIRDERVLATPAAKRIAKERGIDLVKIRGSGPEGMILEKDLQVEIGAKGLDLQKPEPTIALEVSEVIQVVGMRKVIAERLTHSYRTAPHVAITMEVDMTRALNMQRELLEDKGIKIPMTALLANVTAKALRDNPMINSVFEDNQIRVIKDINIGIAIALEDGLIVPVLSNADKKSLSESALAVARLIDKAKTRSLSLEELNCGTFTITNLGSFGVDVFTPIINPPQAAILGVGRIAEKPVAMNGKCQIAPMMTLTLVFNHRIVDGAKAAQFLARTKELLEKV